MKIQKKLLIGLAVVGGIILAAYLWKGMKKPAPAMGDGGGVGGSTVPPAPVTGGATSAPAPPVGGATPPPPMPV